MSNIKELSKRLERSGRLLLLLEAAERAAMTPLESRRLHAFAYLSDVLSPVWKLPAFDGKILKVDDGPYYPDLQDELDRLVVLGLVELKDIGYAERGKVGARLEGKYALNFDSDHLKPLLSALGAGGEDEAVDPSDCDVHRFMVHLAEALATLPNGEVDKAASYDATYEFEGTEHNIVDFGDLTEMAWRSNSSLQTSNKFESFLPEELTLSPGEKLYLYAAYLGKRVAHVA